MNLFKYVYAKDQKPGNLIRLPMTFDWNAQKGQVCLFLTKEGFKIDGLQCYRIVLLGPSSVIVDRAVYNFLYETYEIQNHKRYKPSKTRSIARLSEFYPSRS